MHKIHEVRLFGNDLVARAHNGTDHLRDLFAGATEPRLHSFIETRLSLIDDILTDTMLALELSGVAEDKALASKVEKTIGALGTARGLQRDVTAVITNVLAMRTAADALARQLGATVADFLSSENDAQYFTRFWIDNALDANADRLQKARRERCATVVERAEKLRDAIIAIHEVRVVLLTMFCEHDYAEDAYQKALEVLTGAKQPAAAPSKLTESMCPGDSSEGDEEHAASAQ